MHKQGSIEDRLALCVREMLERIADGYGCSESDMLELLTYYGLAAHVEHDNEEQAALCPACEAVGALDHYEPVPALYRRAEQAEKERQGG